MLGGEVDFCIGHGFSVVASQKSKVESRKSKVEG